jgi:Holliday junction resolvase RusA-like endonuclease
MKVAATKKYRRLAKEAVEAEDIQTAPWDYVTTQPIFYHKISRRRDEDNYQSMLKAAYDGIVDAGLVSDDDHLHMRKHHPKFLVDKVNPRVEIRILNGN